MNPQKHPNFFIIGAPKCGTTALSEYLRTHPDIFFSEPKEPDFFNTDLPSTKIYQYTSLEDYLKRCFSGSRRYRMAGEGSVRYLYSTVAVKKILEFNPDAKFIVMVRNPVDLGHSLYHQHLRSNNESVQTYEEAWRLQGARARGEHIPEMCANPKLLQYDERCRLGKQIERLYAQVSREQVLVIPFKDFVTDTRAWYVKTLHFLGVADDGRTAFPVINEYVAFRSKLLSALLEFRKYWGLGEFSKRIKTWLGIANWPGLVALTKWNGKKLPKRPISEAFRVELTEHFKDDVALFHELTGINLYEQ